MSEATPFDPFSDSNKTACCCLTFALGMIIFASFMLGKYTNKKNSAGFRTGMFTIFSGIAAFIVAVYILWAYD